jgi:hypothetical protein
LAGSQCQKDRQQDGMPGAKSVHHFFSLHLIADGFDRKNALGFPNE